MAEEVPSKESSGGKGKTFARLVNVKPTKHFTSSSFERNWLLVDAEGQSVGRLATQLALLLKGKHKPQYTPHDDVGDFVVVVNAAKSRISWKREGREKTVL